MDNGVGLRQKKQAKQARAPTQECGRVRRRTKDCPGHGSQKKAPQARGQEKEVRPHEKGRQRTAQDQAEAKQARTQDKGVGLHAQDTGLGPHQRQQEYKTQKLQRLRWKQDKKRKDAPVKPKPNKHEAQDTGV